MAEGVKPVWICDLCGYIWLKGYKYPYQCIQDKCRSRRWNDGQGLKCWWCKKLLQGRQTRYCSRDCHNKDRAIHKPRPREISSIWKNERGGHHDLCACIICLQAVKHQADKPKRDAREGVRQPWVHGYAANGGGEGRVARLRKRSKTVTGPQPQPETLSV